MAKNFVVQLVDDIDDKVFDEGSGEHITFSVNGQEYEIDLNDKNAKEFHRKLDYYVSHSAKVGSKRGRQVKKAAVAETPKRDAAQIQAIRAWAIASGYDVSTRGRIPAGVEEACNAAH